MVGVGARSGLAAADAHRLRMAEIMVDDHVGDGLVESAG